VVPAYPGNPTQIGEDGLDLLLSFEGCVLYAYDDADGSNPRKRIMPGDPVRGVLTIGHGHTGPDVFPGQEVTEDQANELLVKDLGPREAVVANNVKVKLRQTQFDALVCFVYNVGAGNFLSSTLLKKLNAGDDYGAAEQFLRWTKQTIGGTKIEVAGLVRRRRAERALFLK
jgi:lysozyme